MCGQPVSKEGEEGETGDSSKDDTGGSSGGGSDGGGNGEKKRKRAVGGDGGYKGGGSCDDVSSLRVAVRLLREVFAADKEFELSQCGGVAAAAVVVVSGWEGQETALEAARAAADEGEALLAKLE